MPPPIRAHKRVPAGVSLFRVATERRSYGAADVSGTGAAAEPGRWNKTGESVLYTTTSIALATLETAAHVNPAGLPLNKFLVEIVVPPEAWARREILDVGAIGPAWKAVPSGATSQRAGSDWLRSRRSALLLVPSVIVPEEYCVLINPAHPGVKDIRAIVRRRMEYDMLFR